MTITLVPFGNESGRIERGRRRTLEAGCYCKEPHNEAAPAQHELAPIYDQANVAVDHNQMVMETLKKVAGRHGLTCLFTRSRLQESMAPASTTTGLWYPTMALI